MPPRRMPPGRRGRGGCLPRLLFLLILAAAAAGAYVALSHH